MKTYNVDPDIALDALRKVRASKIVDGHVVVIEQFIDRAGQPVATFYWQFRVQAGEVKYRGVTTVSPAAA